MILCAVKSGKRWLYLIVCKYKHNYMHITRVYIIMECNFDIPLLTTNHQYKDVR